MSSPFSPVPLLLPSIHLEVVLVVASRPWQSRTGRRGASGQTLRFHGRRCPPQSTGWLKFIGFFPRFDSSLEWKQWCAFSCAKCYIQVLAQCYWSPVLGYAVSCGAIRDCYRGRHPCLRRWSLSLFKMFCDWCHRQCRECVVFQTVTAKKLSVFVPSRPGHSALTCCDCQREFEDQVSIPPRH